MSFKLYYHSLGNTVTEGSITGSTFSASDTTLFPTRLTDNATTIHTYFRGQNEVKGVRFANASGLSLTSLVCYLRSVQPSGQIDLYSSSNATTGYSLVDSTNNLESWSILEFTADSSAYFVVQFSGYYDVDVGKIMLGSFWNPHRFDLTNLFKTNPGSDVLEGYSGVEHSNRKSNLEHQFTLSWKILSETEKDNLQSMISNYNGKFLMLYEYTTPTRMREEWYFVDFVTIPVIVELAYQAYSVSMTLRGLKGEWFELFVGGEDDDDDDTNDDDPDPEDDDEPEDGTGGADSPLNCVRIWSMWRVGSDGRFGIMYQYYDGINSRFMVAIGKKKKSGEIDFGTPVLLVDDVLTYVQGAGKEFAQNKEVIVFVDNRASKIYGKILTLTDMEISAGASNDLESVSAVQQMDMGLTGALTFNFYYGLFGANVPGNWPLYAKACTISGDTITEGAETTWADTTTLHNFGLMVTDSPPNSHVVVVVDYITLDTIENGVEVEYLMPNYVFPSTGDGSTITSGVSGVYTIDEAGISTPNDGVHLYQDERGEYSYSFHLMSHNKDLHYFFFSHSLDVTSSSEMWGFFPD